MSSKRVEAVPSEWQIIIRADALKINYFAIECSGDKKTPD
jgi:hypothetical protein